MSDQTASGRNSGAGSPTSPMSVDTTMGSGKLTSPIPPPGSPSRVSTSSPFMPGSGNGTSAGTEPTVVTAPADGAK